MFFSKHCSNSVLTRTEFGGKTFTGSCSQIVVFSIVENLPDDVTDEELREKSPDAENLITFTHDEQCRGYVVL